MNVNLQNVILRNHESEVSQSGAQPSETTGDIWSRGARRIRVPLGFIFAVVYVWLARPTRTSLMVGALLLLPRLVLRRLAFRPREKKKPHTHLRPPSPPP